ncbi:MAG: alkaline phosphatase family protein, partial [Deltaproteobacteria bacterium]|nr:alkaline phosphatase family protein [Deltaproteobacteria bacterium]
PMTISIAGDQKSALIEIEGCDPFRLEPETYSDWVHLSFKAGLGIKVRGIARFYITSLEPEFNLYMTPIHIDPENPAMPVSHPTVYSIYLAKKLGPFATLGLAEDTWALNERVIDEKAFFEQAMLFCEERERMFKDSLAKLKKGVVTTVFDTTDRVQHMFYRYLDPTHPANEGKDTEVYKDAIAQVYERMDSLLGEVFDLTEDPKTLFMVISDHGFTNFRRGVNLNTWLKENGYLQLKDGAETSGDWFEAVDWSRTRAFSLGLTGMFINRRGRERSGIVNEGEEYETLKNELIEKLKALEDPQTGRRAILDVFAATDFFDDRLRRRLPPQLAVRHGSGDPRGLQRQHQELERRPLRGPPRRAGRVLLQSPDRERDAESHRHRALRTLDPGQGAASLHAGPAALRRAARARAGAGNARSEAAQPVRSRAGSADRAAGRAAGERPKGRLRCCAACCRSHSCSVVLRSARRPRRRRPAPRRPRRRESSCWASTAWIRTSSIA